MALTPHELSQQITQAKQTLEVWQANLDNPGRYSRKVTDLREEIARLNAEIDSLLQQQAELPTRIEKQKRHIEFLEKQYEYETTQGAKQREYERLKLQIKQLAYEIRNDTIAKRKKGEKS